MSQIKNFFIFIRWPITLGLTAALAVLVLFPEKFDVTTPSFNISLPSTTEKPERMGVVSYSQAVKKASMGVVNVYTRKEVKQRLHPLINDPVFRHFFNSADIPRQRRMQSALGSGVIVTEQGHILTNHHVISGADEIIVALEDGRNARAKVLGVNRERDLAVLKVDLGGLQPVIIKENAPEAEIGDVVLAIGNPFGVGQTVTQGIIGATQNRNRNLSISDFEDFIQTDASIHPGSSGGALIDAYGNLIGINTARIGSDGISLAVPIGIAMQTLNDIVKFGRVVRGWLGVEAKPLNPRRAHESGLSTNTGVIITRTTPNGPANNAGLQRGDIIIGIGGNPVKEVTDIIQTIQESRPGEVVNIEFIRGGKVASLNVVLEEQPLAAN